LFVGTSYSRYVYRLESQHFPLDRFTAVLKWRERFLQALPATLRWRVVFRLHSLDYEWGQVQRLQDACGPVRFDVGRQSLRRRMEQARVSVIEYNGTAFLEALAWNRPVVLFWDPALLAWREDAAPYIDAFSRAGILHASPEAASRQVADVYEAPWAWWTSEPVQEARRRFVQRYALGGRGWVRRWIDELELATPWRPPGPASCPVADALLSETHAVSD
jgi:putative transferase (TIGR04331 family)